MFLNGLNYKSQGATRVLLMDSGEFSPGTNGATAAKQFDNWQWCVSFLLVFDRE